MSQREDILDAMTAAFGTISIANGYNTNVDSVFRELRDFQLIKSGQCPAITFGPDPAQTEQIDYTPTHRIEVQFKIRVIFHVLERIGEPRQEAISNLRKDILDCVNRNHRWGELAIDTKCSIVDTDEAEAHISEQIGSAGMQFTVEFHEYLTKPV